MFRGITTTSLDAKGRMGLPVRARDGLMAYDGGDLVVTIDTDEKCLLLYPLSVWDELQTRIQSMDNLGSVARVVQRLMIGHATDVQIDSSGRVLLPAMLRSFAGLDKTAVLVGQGRKFEIWDETNWYTRRAHWLETSEEALAKAREVIVGLSV